MSAIARNDPLFLRITEAARLLSMSRSAAYQAIYAGQIPAIRVAGKWRVPRAALERLLRQAMGAPDGEGGEAR
jgi:excisionase family DNA binding protein